MDAQVEPRQGNEAGIYDGDHAHVLVKVREYRGGRKGTQGMSRREGIIPGLLYQELVVLVEEGPVPAGDVLDYEISDGDAQEQSYEHLVTVLASRVGSQEDKGHQDPDHTQVARAGDGDHQLIHKGGI